MGSRARDALTTRGPGRGSITFRRRGDRTVLARAFATSPLRILTPRNHGHAAWVFLSSFGGGLVDGDAVDLILEAEPHSSGLVCTQASTKVYRSPRGCSQRLEAHVAEGATMAILPDPVVPFAGARYTQRIDVSLAANASLLLFDATSCGRAARGERWQFARLESRTEIMRADQPIFADATLLDPAHGSIAERMGPYEWVASLVAIGPRFADVRRAMLGPLAPSTDDATTVWAASPLRDDGVVVRVAADRFENASRVLRPSFALLARWLGDDPLARKW
ncbi:MAG: urease accessory protein UreD [Polyangiaceae bacterium]